MVTKPLTIAEIEAALKRSGGVIVEAARLMGAHEASIRKVLARHRMKDLPERVKQETQSRFRIGPV